MNATLTHLLHFNRDPLSYFTQLRRRHGDVARLQVGPATVFLVSDPELIREVLVTQEKSFRKGRGLQLARRVVGNGLLTSEGDFHRQQRKLMQPVFHRQRVAAFGDCMARAARETSWRSGETIDALQSMQRLALRIVGRTLFDEELEQHAQTVSRALDDGRHVLRLGIFPFFEKLERMIPPLRRRGERSRRLVESTLAPLIEERRRQPRQDLLSMLIEAQMSDEQVRDEAVTLFLAGHETTANQLAWTLHLLAGHPAVQARLHAELDLVLQGRIPTAEDMPRLPYTEHVLLESMRLFPPAWMIGRQALEDVQLGDLQVKQGNTVLTSQWVVHRDERWFPQPERFDPSRWERQPRASLPRYAYFPFGGGSRVCIGEHFAMMEATLVLATLLARWQLAPEPGQTVKPKTSITLRPSPDPRIRLQAR